MVISPPYKNGGKILRIRDTLSLIAWILFYEKVTILFFWILLGTDKTCRPLLENQYLCYLYSKQLSQSCQEARAHCLQV